MYRLLVASDGKEPTCAGRLICSWVGKIPVEGGHAMHSVFPAWRSPWTEGLVGLVTGNEILGRLTVSALAVHG